MWASSDFGDWYQASHPRVVTALTVVAGSVEAYASYFNLDGCVFQIHVDGCNPAAAEAYRSRAGAF